MMLITSILLLFMINVVHGNPVNIQVNVEIDDCGCIGTHCGPCIGGPPGPGINPFPFGPNPAICDPSCEHGVCTTSGTCTCYNGWIGPCCEIPKKPICDPSCEHGVCTTSGTCTCYNGWIGPCCEIPKKPICNPICVHGGCTDPDTCTCDEGWTGIICDIPICDPSCENGGNCTAPDTCSCTNEYTGPTCETPICEPGCENGGNCTAPNTCFCTNEYTGPTCETHCPRVEIVAGGDGFAFIRCTKTYSEARNFCQINGWSFATPDEQFVEFNEKIPARSEFWLDVRADNNTDVWYWQTSPIKQETTVEQWQRGIIPVPPPYCASAYKDNWLTEYECTKEWYFVCESDDFKAQHKGVIEQVEFQPMKGSNRDI